MSLNSISTKVGLGATSIYTANMINLFLSTISLAILTNFLSTTDIRVIAGIRIITFGIASIIGLSLAQTASRFASNYISIGDENKARGFSKQCLFIVVLLSLVFFLIIITLSEDISSIFFNNKIDSAWLAISALNLVSFSITQVLIGIMWGQNRIPAASSYQIIASLLRNILSISMVIYGMGVFGAIIGYLLADLLINFLLLRNLSGFLKGDTDYSSSDDLFKFVIPLFISSFIIFFQLNLDKIFVQLNLGLPYLGVYNIAVIATSVASFIPQSISFALIPALSGLLSKNDREGFISLSRSYTRYISIIVIPASFGIAALSPLLLKIFGPQYVIGSSSLAIVAIFVGLSCPIAVYTGQLISNGNTKLIMTSNILGLFTLIAITPVLIANFEMFGAALGKSIMSGIIFLSLILFVKIKGFFTIDYKSYFASIFSSLMLSILLYSVIIVTSSYNFQFLLVLFLIPIMFTLHLMILRLSNSLNESDFQFFKELLPEKLHPIVIFASKIALN